MPQIRLPCAVKFRALRARSEEDSTRSLKRSLKVSRLCPAGAFLRPVDSGGLALGVEIVAGNDTWVIFCKPTDSVIFCPDGKKSGYRPRMVCDSRSFYKFHPTPDSRPPGSQPSQTPNRPNHSKTFLSRGCAPLLNRTASCYAARK